ncbi:MAG: MASE1 domain-containing protein [Pseudomonadota bacterium]|nr:MASE1 domain-containing protein [Pseudomonadota bacterium]
MLTAAYFLAARLGLQMAIIQGNVSPVWPASGLALAALLLGGYRLWPGVALGAFAATAATGAPLPAAAGVAVGNTLEALLGVWLLNRHSRFRQPPWRVHDIFVFVVLAALLSTQASATLGTLSLWLGGMAPQTVLNRVWWTWWLGDAIGALVVAPLLVLWALAPRPVMNIRRWVEAALLLVLLVGIGQVVFGDWLFSAAEHYPLTFLPLPLLVWGALRFGSHGMVVLNVLIAVMAVWGTLRGLGPFVVDTLDESLLLVQGFTGLLSATGLVLAAVVEERARAQRDLQESEARFRQLVEHLEAVFWINDVDSRRVLYVSPAYERLWGRPRQNVFASPLDWLEAIHPDDQPRIRQAFEEQMRSGVFDEEYRLLHPDGTVRWVHDRGFPVRDAAGRLYRIAGIVQDVTETRRLEQELTTRLRQQAAVAALGQQALRNNDPDALLREATALITRVLEVEYAKILELLADGETLLLRAGSGWRDGCVGHVTLKAEPGGQAGYTLRCRKPVIVEDLASDGRFGATPLLLEHGVVSGISVIIDGRQRPFGILGAHARQRRTFTEDDIHFLQAVAHILAAATSQRQLANEMQHRQAELAHMDRLSLAGELASGLAHELKQPLTAIGNYADACLLLLRRQPPDIPQALAAVEQLALQSQRIGGIVNRMKDFTRKAPPRRRRLDVNLLIREAAQFIDIELRRHRAALDLDLAGPELGVFADAVQIQQVIINLVSNALEAMEAVAAAQRRVRIEARPAGDRVEVAVSDTGPGIAAAIRERLFQPFATSKADGTGLGLAISKTIVEAHGGRLWADPDAGGGATFRFTLPAAG